VLTDPIMSRPATSWQRRQDGWVRAMLASRGALPDEPGWAFEMTWAGPRLLVDIAHDRVLAHDDHERDVTTLYPELVAMAGGIADALLDGHLIGLGDDETPMNYVIVDLLRLYGVDLTRRPYHERRRSLIRLAAAHSLLTVSPSFDDARATASAAREHGLAGVIAKRLTSVYRPGVTSTEWIEHRFPTGGAHG
jgi:bifunctional non-homologous end joining protein LigD